MSLYLLSGVAAAATAVMLTPLIGRGSTALGPVDAPGWRKVHSQAVPRVGGVAIALSAALALALAPRSIPLAPAMHIHHRLLSRGWSIRGAALVLYVLTLVLSLVALATASLN